jgi:hypothetical protein
VYSYSIGLIAVVYFLIENTTFRKFVLLPSSRERTKLSSVGPRVPASLSLLFLMVLVKRVTL